MNSGNDAHKPSTNIFFEPHLSCTGGKINNWDKPMTVARIDPKVPIARSERPRPPSFIGVERYSAWVSK